MTKKTYVVAVDSGKYTTKAVLMEGGAPQKKFYMDTKMRETVELQAKDSKTHVLTLNGVSTVLGAESEMPDMYRTKKRDVHRRMTYLSLAQLVPTGSNVILAIGCPLSMYMMQEVMDEYERFMMGVEEGELSFPVTLKFDVDGTPYSYNVEELVSSPETSGYIFKNADDYASSNIAVIDIGGLNINGAIYSPVDYSDPSKGIDIIDGTNVTLEAGTHHFTESLVKRLSSELDISLHDSVVKQIILNGYIDKKLYKEESIRIIKDEKRKYVQELIGKFRAAKWSLDTMNFVFVGGGSLLLKEQILEDPLFEDAIIPENAQWENVEGFGLVAESLLLEA